MELETAQFEKLRQIIQKEFGISLGENKQTLMANRLRNYLSLQGFDSYDQLIAVIEEDKTGDALNDLANLISTNYTFFFREWEHFELLSEVVLPELKGRLQRIKSNDIRLWCAAASSGEEAYSLTIAMMEYFGSSYSSYDAGLLATDISMRALEKGASGRYTLNQIERVPTSYREKYFVQVNEGEFEAIEALRREVLFRKFNLLDRHYPFKKPFDIIFCRNVMIYFDARTRQDLIEKLFRMTVPGGYLFVGRSEGIAADRRKYEYVSPAVYRRPIQ